MAKKKSPAELKQEGVELGEKLNAARKKPYNFALSMGKDGLVLETHLTKSADVLWRIAKKSGGGPKGAMGVMNVKGKIIELTCSDDKVPGPLTKLAKKFFAERGLVYKVVLVLPSGEVGDDGEDAAQSPAPERVKAKAEPKADEMESANRPTPEKTAEASEDKKQIGQKRKPELTKAFGALKPEVLGLMKRANPEQRNELQGLMKQFGKHLNAGAFETSEETLAKLRQSMSSIIDKRAQGTQKRKSELADMHAQTDALLARLKTLRDNKRAA